MNLSWRSNGEATQFGLESIKLQLSTSHSGVVQSKASQLDIDEKWATWCRSVDCHLVLTQSVHGLSTLSSESSCADSVKEQTETI
ncbi:hypothetical protein MRB53_034211 [Persea americana]|uniref:Uncharacterized protein n=1 Tax=Persea americana TaxID=3435 RepID=A0ACC2KX05_PERAE|nr:hypothetical protein MRB53_034211 [Persea americana]